MVVNFPQYVGPKWDLDNPTVSYIKYSTKIHNIQSKSYSSFQKHVPIPTASYRCDKNCCLCTYVPLEVSYARTIHKFQGLTAGPVDEGKIPNMYQCIVCDPDEKNSKALLLDYFTQQHQEQQHLEMTMASTLPFTFRVVHLTSNA